MRDFIRSRTVWFAVLAILLVCAPIAKFLFPCGCLGLSFWRPAALPVLQLPAGCAVLQTPAEWQDGRGRKFDTAWWDQLERQTLDFEFDKISNYRVSVGADGTRLLSLATADAPERSAANVFRQAASHLVATRPPSSPNLLPITFAGYAYGDLPSPEHSPRGRAADKPEWEAFHSFIGPPLALPYRGLFSGFTWDVLVPWSIRRNGFVEFHNWRTGQPTPLIEYLFCGGEGWMRMLAAWHGGDVFTMPLSLDGRSLLMCSPGKRKIN